MNPRMLVRPSLLAVAAWTATSLLPGVTPAFAASVSLNLPSCTAFTLSDTGGGNYSLNCTTGPTAPGAPTNCVVTATTTPSPITSSGGQVSLAATCSGTTASTTWSWARGTTSISGTGATTSDTLPANSGQAAVSYSYVATVCNGTACASAGTSVTVPGTSGGPVIGGPIACSGYASTLVIDLPWANAQGASRILTANKGSFGTNDAMVIRFTVPAGVQSTSPGMIGMAEYGGGQVGRFATLSQTACDFGKTAWFVDVWQGNSLTIGMQVGGAPSSYAALVQPGQTYYLNVRNTNRWGTKTCTESSCNMYIEFTKPAGT